MSEQPHYDVICLGGPFDGKITPVREGKLTWQVWRPILFREGGFGKELMGSYVVADDRICAYWMPTAGIQPA